jgi:hypothetical protein
MILDALLPALKILYITYPVWLPVILGFGFLDIWLRYKRLDYVFKQNRVLLEFKLPREIAKSPAAMEVILSALHNPGTGTWLDVYLKGRVKMWSSLELVSIGGQVHFYMWVTEQNKALVERYLYAQYPEVEVYQVADYTDGLRFDADVFDYAGYQFTLTKPDAYPIKTYIDYGLDKDPKEEFKVDPITPMIEYLGSLREGENAYIHLLIQPHSKMGLKQGVLRPIPEWQDAAKAEIEKMIGKGKDDTPKKFSDLSDNQKIVVNAIERSLGKFAFDTVIRGMYYARKDRFRPESKSGLIGIIKQFNSNALNGLKPKWETGFDYPWQDPFGNKTTKRKKKLLKAFRQRGAFQYPFKNFGGKPFVMTTEELATMFHFPGEVAATPTLTRIPSKKAEAPANLPI